MYIYLKKQNPDRDKHEYYNLAQYKHLSQHIIINYNKQYLLINH